MTTLTPIEIKKSSSLCDGMQNSVVLNLKHFYSIQREQSRVEQLINKKYSFSTRLYSNNNQELKKKYSNYEMPIIPSSNLTIINQLPLVQTKVIKKKQVFKNQKLNSFKQNCIFQWDYQTIESPKRKLTEPKKSRQKTQKDTAYRRFDFNYSTINNKTSPSQTNKLGTEIQERKKPSLDLTQRKKLIQYIIQKGFARKMQDSLLKIRTQKKKNNGYIVLAKNIKQLPQYQSKKSVFDQESPSIKKYQQKIPQTQSLKQNDIRPW